MHFTLSQAAKEAGASKSTISKALARGRLSGERLEDGSFRIEASELFRVFPKRTAETGAPKGAVTVRELKEGTGERSETGHELLRLELQMVREQLAREQVDRERERERHERERDMILERERTTVEDLRKRLDRAEDRILALSAPTTAKHPQGISLAATPPEKPAQPARSFIARLFGRTS